VEVDYKKKTDKIFSPHLRTAQWYQLQLKKVPWFIDPQSGATVLLRDLCKTVQATVIPKPGLLSVNKQIKNELK